MSKSADIDLGMGKQIKHDYKDDNDHDEDDKYGDRN